MQPLSSTSHDPLAERPSTRNRRSSEHGIDSEQRASESTSVEMSFWQKRWAVSHKFIADFERQANGSWTSFRPSLQAQSSPPRWIVMFRIASEQRHWMISIHAEDFV
jgi:hypothetical protein